MNTNHSKPFFAFAFSSILVLSIGCLSDPKSKAKEEHGHGEHSDHDHGEHSDHGHDDAEHTEDTHDKDAHEHESGGHDSGDKGHHQEDGDGHDKDKDGHHDESDEHVSESHLSTQQLLKHVQDSENFVFPEFTKKRK